MALGVYLLDDAERAVIGAVLQRNEVLERLTLQPRDFMNPVRGAIWTAMLELEVAGKPIDPVTIPIQLNGRGATHAVVEMSECLRGGWTVDNVEYYADNISSASEERRLRISLSALASNENLNAEELVARTKQIIERIEPGPAAQEKRYGLSMAELMEVEDDEDDIGDWRIRGLIPATGPSIIVGEPKAKKTFIIEHLALSMAIGVRCWLNQAELGIRAGRVLVLALEDDFKVTRRRLRRLSYGLGYEPRDIENLRVEPKLTPFRFDRPADVDRLRRSLDAWKPDLICVDSLAKTHAVDENSTEKMAPILETWEAICREYSCAVTALHHMNKPNASNQKARLGNRMRGSSSLFAFVRHLVGVERVDKDNSAVDFDGNMLFQPDPFTVEIVDGVNKWGKPTTTLTYAGAKTGSPASADLKAAVLAALMETAQSATQLVADLKKRKASVLLALKELSDERKVRNDGYKWSIVS